MIVRVLITLVAMPQSEQPRDTVDAIQRAMALVSEYYSGPQGRGPWETLLLRGPPLPLTTSAGPPSAAACRDESWDGCFGGDWSCRAFARCLHPDQAVRRRNLIEELERVAPLAGGSEWVYRQRVAFADKNGEPERASRIARSCTGTVWWCMALVGYTDHRLHPGSGLESFESALALAPDSVACVWLDISPLMSSAMLPACSSGDPVRLRFWWLADPLWSRPGNERHAEHLARHVMTQMERDVRGEMLRWCDRSEYVPTGMPNSTRLGEMRRSGYRSPLGDAVAAMARCRVPAFPELFASVWDTIQPGLIQRNPDRRAHGRSLFRYVYGGYSFVPDSVRFVAPLLSTAGDWAVYWDRGSERMIPREKWYNLEHQTAVFRRGADLLVVVAAPLGPPLDTVAQLVPVLALGRVEDRRVITIAARVDDSAVFRASASVEDGSWIASIEIAGPQLVGRARHGAPAPPLTNGFGLSDLALVDADYKSRSLRLEDALLPTPRIERGEPVGVHFEIYGVSEQEKIEVALTGESIGRASFFSRVLGAIGLRSQPPPLHVIWEEILEPAGERTLDRFFLLDADNLHYGENRLTLAVTRADGTTVRASRMVQIHR